MAISATIRTARRHRSHASIRPRSTALQIRQACMVGLCKWPRETTLSTIANGFVTSAEFTSRFGAKPQQTPPMSPSSTQMSCTAAPTAVASRAGTTSSPPAPAGRTSLVGFSESAENRKQHGCHRERGHMETWTRTGPQVARLYTTRCSAACPTWAVLAGWEGQLDSGAMSLDQVAASFTTASEFVARYGTLSSTAFVSALYVNTLHRSADAPGLAGWVGQLNAGASKVERPCSASRKVPSTRRTQRSTSSATIPLITASKPPESAWMRH